MQPEKDVADVKAGEAEGEGGRHRVMNLRGAEGEWEVRDRKLRLFKRP